MGSPLNQSSWMSHKSQSPEERTDARLLHTLVMVIDQAKPDIKFFDDRRDRRRHRRINDNHYCQLCDGK